MTGNAHTAPDSPAPFDPLAFARLIDEHRSALNAFCASYHADHDDRQELAQLVMIRVWRGLDGFDGRSAFRTWLYQVVRNTAASEFRRRAQLPLPVERTEDLLDPASAREAFEDAVVARDELSAALGDVRQPYRSIVVLVDVWGCPHAEAARICDVPEQTVRTRLWRGRQAMRAALSAEAA